jgi:hypothetical protein
VSTVERGGLKAAFANFKKPDPQADAEMKLLGRTVESAEAPVAPARGQIPDGYPVATSDAAGLEKPGPAATGGLMPRPLLRREAVRQLSFRCPVSIAAELRRKAAFNQLEQQEIIVEGLRRVLAELPTPPETWEDL